MKQKLNILIKSFSRVFLALLVVVMASSFTLGIVFAADYVGSGHFPTSNLGWCHSGSYYNENISAVGQWGVATILFLGADCSSPDFKTYGTNYGNTGWAGHALICAGSACNNSTAWNNTFTLCWAQSNSYYVSGWSFSELKYNAMHELGHCWSLAHRWTSSTVMEPGQLSRLFPDSTDGSLVDARH